MRLTLTTLARHLRVVKFFFIFLLLDCDSPPPVSITDDDFSTVPLDEIGVRGVEFVSQCRALSATSVLDIDVIIRAECVPVPAPIPIAPACHVVVHDCLRL